ncbi:Dynamin-related protein 4C [Metarhizium anisopliae]|nr:Dynamin-related protein 4C [Metarhizium anisopliae]
MVGKGGTQSGKSLTSPDRLHKIDQLREKNVGTHMPLPQLVVVGDQSSGKSSLLESLTGIPFPNGQGLCTRYATQITHRRDNVEDITIRIIPGPDSTDEDVARLSGYQHSVKNTDALLVQFESILIEVRNYTAITL